jgi:hypothetical protein
MRLPVAAVGLLVLLATPAWAGAPTDQLRQTVEDVLKILNNPALKSPAKREERRAELRRVLHKTGVGASVLISGLTAESALCLENSTFSHCVIMSANGDISQLEDPPP